MDFRQHDLVLPTDTEQPRVLPFPTGPGLPLGNKHVEVYGSCVAWWRRTHGSTRDKVVTLDFIQ